MKYVYVVEETYAYDGSGVLGVFSSVAKAKKFLGKNYITPSVHKPEKRQGYWQWKVGNQQWVSISRMEIDKPQ